MTVRQRESREAVGAASPAPAKTNTQLAAHHKRSADCSRWRRYCNTVAFTGDIPYGQEWPDSDSWSDADGRIYHGDGDIRLPLLRMWDRLIGVAS